MIEMPAKKHSGRRPGESGTREAIAEAARRQFAGQGFDRTTLRSVALEAGVDPALISHFYGGKHQLFAAVVELPFDPEEVLPRLLSGPRSRIGRRFAEFFLQTMESEEAQQRILGVVRSAASEPEAARLIRTLISDTVIATVVRELRVEDAALRASLVGSQFVGLAMARYVIRIEPIASASPQVIVSALAPTLQRYLTGRLD